MSENLTGRVGRIISGSVNALVGAIENAIADAANQEKKLKGSLSLRCR